MEFVILGPFEVLERGRKLALGATGQQALLAVLLLDRDRVVASDRLIDLLWGERPPRTAAKTVQVYVSRLRKVLGDQVLVTEGRGYRLVLAADQVDAERFERLSREGRAEFDAGDARRAVALFGDALALWRGAPLEDFAYRRFAQVEIERLAELKLAVIEDRLDAQLALGGDGRLVPELEVLVGTNPLRERLRGQLMLALYRAGRHSDALAVYRQASTMLRSELGLEPSPALRELERRILDHDPSLSDGERAATAGGAARPALCPFKGIASFDRSDANLFFGRERIIGDLVARVAEGDLVGIIGPSGTGKSSLLRAGLLAALNAGALPGSGRWRQALLRPGEHPADQLLSALGGVQLDEVLDALRPGERLVIAVDQLEELFTQCASEPERRRLIAVLSTAARDPDRRAVVIVALRSDFYGRLAPYRGFGQLLTRSHVLVGPMDRAELASAIEKPAALAGLDVEERLVDELVSDVAGELGGLPLLSAALLELWRAGEGRALRLETYRASGGIHAAVARLAENAYGQLDEPAREIARSVMLRLATEQDGTPTRRRAPAAELEAIDGAAPVLATLIDARLLTQAAGSVEVTHEALLLHWPRYAEWRDADRVGNQIRTRLATAAREWDAHRRDTADVYRGARLAGVLDWAAEHGDQLNPLEHAFIEASRIETDREQRRQQLQNRRLRELLAIAGVLACAAVFAAVVAVANQHSANAEARRARAAARRVTAADRVAVGRELAAQAVSEPDLPLAMKIAREAVALDGSAESRSALLATLDRYPAIIGALKLPGSATAQPVYSGVDFRGLVGESLGPQGLPAFSPNGRQLAVGDSLGPVRLYDAATHTLLASGANDFVAYQPPVYSPDGSLIVYNGSEGDEDLEVRDAQTLRLTASLPVANVTKPEYVPGGNVAIAPDDRTVYYAYWENYPSAVGLAYIERWSLPSGRGPTVPIGTESILAMRLIDGGSRLLLIGNRSVSEFDARSLRRLFAVRYAPSPVAPTTAAIVPGGRGVAIGAQNGAVWFVNSTTGAAREGSVLQQGGVLSVLDSPLTGAVVTVGAEGGVIVWDPATARPLQILDGPPVQPTAAALSPDGSTLYTAGRDGALLEWDLAGSRRFGARAPIGSASACCSPVSPLAPAFALSPDGSRFAALVGPTTVGVFATVTRVRLAAFTTPTVRGISALAFAPSGMQLGVGGRDGAVQLWSVAGRPKVIGSFRISEAVASAPDTVESISFSSSGSLVVTSDEANVDGPGTWANGDASTFEITSAATRALIFVNDSSSTLEGGQPATGLSARYGEALTAFAPGESSIAATTFEEGYLNILNATGGEERQLDIGPNTTALAFAPDGTLAVGTALGTVELWNASTGNEIGSPLSVSDTPVASIAFDHTGNRFLTAPLGAGSVTLWDTASLARLGTFATDPGSTSSVAFDAQGDVMAVDTRGASFVWPLSPTAWEHAACAIADGPISRAEWAQLSTGLAYTPVCQR